MSAPGVATTVRARLGPAASSFRPQRAGVVYALALLLAVLAVAVALKGQPAYLTTVNIANVLGQVAPDAILAVFMTIVLISGNFDLSIASVAALSAAIALKTIDLIGVLPAVLLALLVGTLVGVVNAFLVQRIGVNAFIVTLGALTAVRGFVLILLNGESVTAQSQALVTFDNAVLTLPPLIGVLLGLAILGLAVLRVARPRSAQSPPLDGFFVALVIGGLAILAVAIWAPDLLSQPVPVWLMFAVAVAASLALRFLRIGRNLYAVGSNTEAARLSGIAVDRYKMVPFILSAAAAAGVGLIYAGRFNSVDPNALSGTELTVIAAAILGGTSLFGGAGYVGKSVLGAVVLFTLANGFNVLNLGSNYQYVVQGLVLVAASAVYTLAARARRRPPTQDRPASAPLPALHAQPAE
jgi:D-xylose transport system permease protein